MTDLKPIPLPKRRTTEAVIEAYLRKRVKALGGECVKWSAPNNRGVPDRIVVLPGGAVWFIEVKAPDGRMTTLQKQFISRMVQLGFKNCRVLWTKENIDDWLKGLGYD